ncbi:MAG: four helix bundle protein [Cytophagales bacterium]|nr:four helix bundle protein [Bernardetiaceae bacterium]MDW8205017.1 four helix bundle protein [Cytophagales bacterium]
MPSKEDLKQRTKQFALRIVQLAEALPVSLAGNAIGNQLVRCGTSVAANYRAACRAKSVADFICKIGVVEEEADETLFWLEIIGDSGLIPLHRLQDLQKEAYELTAIFTSIGKTTKQKYRKK